MDEFTTVTEAQALIGGLSNPGKMPGKGWTCPARSQKNQCLECRQCWDPGVINVSYPRH